MGWLTDWWRRRRKRRAPHSVFPSPRGDGRLDDRALLANLAAYDEDPDVRRAAEELLAQVQVSTHDHA